MTRGSNDLLDHPTSACLDWVQSASSRSEPLTGRPAISRNVRIDAAIRYTTQRLYAEGAGALAGARLHQGSLLGGRRFGESRLVTTAGVPQQRRNAVVRAHPRVRKPTNAEAEERPRRVVAHAMSTGQHTNCICAERVGLKPPRFYSPRDRATMVGRLFGRHPFLHPLIARVGDVDGAGGADGDSLWG